MYNIMKQGIQINDATTNICNPIYEFINGHRNRSNIIHHTPFPHPYTIIPFSPYVYMKTVTHKARHYTTRHAPNNIKRDPQDKPHRKNIAAKNEKYI
jgi:hypothetical protein